MTTLNGLLGELCHFSPLFFNHCQGPSSPNPMCPAKRGAPLSGHAGLQNETLVASNPDPDPHNPPLLARPTH